MGEAAQGESIGGTWLLKPRGDGRPPLQGLAEPAAAFQVTEHGFGNHVDRAVVAGPLESIVAFVQVVERVPEPQEVHVTLAHDGSPSQVVCRERQGRLQAPCQRRPRGRVRGTSPCRGGVFAATEIGSGAASDAANCNSFRDPAAPLVNSTSQRFVQPILRAGALVPPVRTAAPTPPLAPFPATGATAGDAPLPPPPGPPAVPAAGSADSRRVAGRRAAAAFVRGWRRSERRRRGNNGARGGWRRPA